MGASAIIAIVAIAAAAASAVYQGYTATQQAEANEELAKAQEETAKMNAEISARHADNIERQADQRRFALNLQMQQAVGSSRVEFASKGVVLGSGVVLDYEADIANAYDLDLRNLNYDVAMDSWRTRMGAADYRQQAAMLHAQGNIFERDKRMSAIGTFFAVGGTTSSQMAASSGTLFNKSSWGGSGASGGGSGASGGGSAAPAAGS